MVEKTAVEAWSQLQNLVLTTVAVMGAMISGAAMEDWTERATM
jgi:hypothetical protein